MKRSRIRKKEQKMMMKKIFTLALAAVLAGTALASCAAKGFDKDGAITVISREKGSGTRSAFIELFGVEVDDEDKTVETADITDKTNVMMTSVSQNANAIGYISLGSLNDSVKALKIDGAAATVENIENGSYKISRPFNIATKATFPRRRRILSILSSPTKARRSSRITAISLWRPPVRTAAPNLPEKSASAARPPLRR